MNTTFISASEAARFSPCTIAHSTRKRIGLVLLFVIGMMAAKAQSNVYHEDSAGCVRVMFNGQKDDGYAVRVIVKNKVKELICVTIVDEEDKKLYSGRWNEQLIDQVFLTDPQNEFLIFKIVIGEKGIARTYDVAFRNTSTYTTSIVALR